MNYINMRPCFPVEMPKPRKPIKVFTWSSEARELAIARAMVNPNAGREFLVAAYLTAHLASSVMYVALFQSAHADSVSKHPLKPSRTFYNALMTWYAWEANVPLALATSRARNPEVCYVRFRVWSYLQNLRYSYPGIGSVAGRHHASIILGVRRIREIEG